MLRGGGLAAIRLGAVRRHRLHRRADRPLPGAQRAAERPLGAGRSQPRQARGGRRRAGGAGERRPRSRPARGRRRRRRRPGRGRGGDPGRDHHRRPLRAPRRAAGRRLRRRRHRLRRPHRRARVRRPDVGRAPRRGGADRGAARPLLRLRLDPARPRRLLHGPAAARGRAAHRRRLRPHQRQLLRRHLPLGDQRLRPRPADDGGGEGAPAAGDAPGRPRGPLGAEPRLSRGGARRLGDTAADDRRRRRPPLRRRARALRPRLHLRSPPRRAPPRHRRRARRRGRRPRRAGAAAADAQAAAQGEIPR